MKQTKNASDMNRKFVAITITWMTLVTTFLIQDIQASISWNPTQFFSEVKNEIYFTNCITPKGLSPHLG